MWIDMHKGHPRDRNVEHSITLRRNFPEPPPDKNDEVAVLYALHEFRIGVQSEIAGVTRVQGIEQRQPAIACRDGHIKFPREVLQRAARFFVPTCAANNNNRPFSFLNQRAKLAHIVDARMCLQGAMTWRAYAGHGFFEHILRKRKNDGTGTARTSVAKGAGNKFNHPRGVIDFSRPFRLPPEHRTVIDFLKGTAAHHKSFDLADE